MIAGRQAANRVGTAGPRVTGATALVLAVSGLRRRLGRSVTMRFVAAGITFLAFTFFLTYPLAFRMSDHVLVLPVVNLLTIWILAWDHHALGSHPLQLFDANIFYPTPQVLALSEHMLANLLIFSPVMVITRNPVLAANCVILASFVLCGLAMFALAWYWTRSFTASLVAGFIYAFTPLRFGHLGHSQLLSAQWAPMALLFLDRFLRGRRLRDGLIAVAFFVLQTFSSYYLGYALACALAAYFLYHLRRDPHLRRPATLAKLAVLVGVGTLAIVPLSYPYIRKAAGSGLLTHDPRGLAVASADPVRSFFSPPLYGDNLYQPLLGRLRARDAPWERWLFPGVLPIALALVSLHRSFRGPAHAEWPPGGGRRWSAATVRAHLLIVVVSLVMSLGPYLVLNDEATGIPLPYLALFHLVPGLSSIRHTARFALMAPLGLGVLAGFGVQLLGERFSPQARSGGLHACVLGSVLIVILAIEFHFTPVPMDRIEVGARVPAVYRWLAEQPKDGAVLEVPWTIDARRNGDPEWRARYAYFDRARELTRGLTNLAELITRARYTYFSAYHWHPLVNGYSGYDPPSYLETLRQLAGFPSRASIDYLRTIGVRRVIVHTDLLTEEEAARWRATALDKMGLTRVVEFGSDVVFGVTSSSPPASVTPGLVPPPVRHG